MGKKRSSLTVTPSSRKDVPIRIVQVTGTSGAGGGTCRLQHTLESQAQRDKRLRLFSNGGDGKGSSVPSGREDRRHSEAHGFSERLRVNEGCSSEDSGGGGGQRNKPRGGQRNTCGPFELSEDSEAEQAICYSIHGHLRHFPSSIFGRKGGDRGKFFGFVQTCRFFIEVQVLTYRHFQIVILEYNHLKRHTEKS